MKPWIDPRERRARESWIIEIGYVIFLMILAVAALLFVPSSPEKTAGIVGILVLGGVLIALGIWQYRRLPYEFRLDEDEPEQHESDLS